MPFSFALPASTLGLGFLFGLRHGLDPDHVAVIDNFTFRLAVDRPRLAPWVGGLFASGHSFSVAMVAIAASMVARLPAPYWIDDVLDWLVIALLVLVGCLNLRALLRPAEYAPLGWRQGAAPKRLLATAHPAGILAVGVIFGLVFDTASQAAAWGLAASSKAGTGGAILVALMFAAGMILTDTLDSQIVARLLRSGRAPARIRLYRRAVGWLIVGLSFGMAGFEMVTKLARGPGPSDDMFLALGGSAALAVIVILLIARRRAGRSWSRMGRGVL